LEGRREFHCWWDQPMLEFSKKSKLQTMRCVLVDVGTTNHTISSWRLPVWSSSWFNAFFAGRVHLVLCVSWLYLLRWSTCLLHEELSWVELVSHAPPHGCWVMVVKLPRCIFGDMPRWRLHLLFFLSEASFALLWDRLCSAPFLTVSWSDQELVCSFGLWHLCILWPLDDFKIESRKCFCSRWLMSSLLPSFLVKFVCTLQKNCLCFLGYNFGIGVFGSPVNLTHLLWLISC
jgi:hypothetical protein